MLSYRLPNQTLEEVNLYIHSGADPEGGFGDLSPLNFLEVKMILNV